VLKIGLKQDMNKETFGDQFMMGTVEIGASAGAGVDIGPLKAEVSVGGGLGIEIDRTGIRDVTVIASAGVSVGTNIISEAGKAGTKPVNTGGITGETEGTSMAGQGISDLSVDLGVEGKVSLISGNSSISGTGLLSGAK
jgi:hypothetical protein